MSEPGSVLSIDGNDTYRQVVDYIAVEAAPEFSLAGTGIEIEQVMAQLDTVVPDEVRGHPLMMERLEELKDEFPLMGKVCRVFASWQGLAPDSTTDKPKFSSSTTELYLDKEFVAIPTGFDVIQIKRDDELVLAPILVSKTTVDNERDQPEVKLLLTPLDEGGLVLFTPILN